MKTKLNCVLALGAGLLGGFISRYAAPPPVLAQSRPAQAQTPDLKEIRAQSFVLTDDQGDVVGIFKSSTPRPKELRTVVLLDRWGRETWRGKGAFIRPLGETFER